VMEEVRYSGLAEHRAENACILSALHHVSPRVDDGGPRHWARGLVGTGSHHLVAPVRRQDPAAGRRAVARVSAAALWLKRWDYLGSPIL